MEKEIKEILNKKLIGNDINISNMILSYLKERCFICWQYFIEEDLVKSYCDTKPHSQLYMNVCPTCVDKFKFKRCYKCRIYVDEQKSYTVGTLDNVCCLYCCMSGITEYCGM
jgi:hypothetical protein